MEPLLFISFLIAALIVIVLPGPNVLVIVSTSVAQGVGYGLLTVAGTTTAMAIQLVIAAFGTAWLVNALSDGFVWLRWLGIVYLVYLGVVHFRSALRDPSERTGAGTATGSFLRGFVISLFNPKTILFFGAFLPQFVTPEIAYLPQILTLSMAFLLLATVLDSLYALLAGRLRRYLFQRQLDPIRHGLSSALYFGCGVWLALTRRF